MKKLLCVLILLVIFQISLSAETNENNFPKTTSREWSIVATYEIPGGASGLAWDGTHLYAGIYGVNGDNVYQIDPDDGSYALLFSGPQEDAFGLTYDGENLWTTDHPEFSDPAKAMEMDMNGNLLSEFFLPDHYMSGIAYDDGDFWVATYYDPEAVIYKVDSSGTIITQFTAPDDQPWDLCIEGEFLWMADYYGDALYKINKSDGTVIESHPSEGSDPSGIVFDGEYLWYCDEGFGPNDNLYKIDLGGSGTPEITIPITEHDFGSVTIGDSATWNATAISTGSADLEIQDLNFSAFEDILSCSLEFPITLEVGEQIDIPITYTPLLAESFTAIASIFSNDPINPEVEISLTGIGTMSGPEIYLPETSHNYGSVRLNSYNGWQMEIGNIGDETLEISNISSDDPTFIIDPDLEFPLNISVLDTTIVSVWYFPQETGTHSGTALIESNSGSGNVEISLAGSANSDDYPMGELLWHYTIDTSYDNTPKAITPIQDINGDGISDVIICSEDNFIRCFNGNSCNIADIIWETYIGTGDVYTYRGLQITDDINEDGYADVVIGTTGGDRSIHTFCGKTGTLIWTHDTHEYGDGGWVYAVSCKFDYNGDGIIDPLAATGDDASGIGPQRIYCLDGLSGNSIWEFYQAGPKFSVVGIEDANNDNIPDVLAGASDGSETQGVAFGIDGSDGSQLWNFDTNGSSVWAVEQLDDVTGDGVMDVIIGDFFGASGPYYGIDPTNGSQLWTGNTWANIITRFVRVDDVNQDGYMDIAVGHSGSSTNALMVNGFDGDNLWISPVADQPWTIDKMNDITGDGINDLIVGTLYGSNYCYFINGVSGEQLCSVSVGTPVDGISSIPDITGDGSREAVVGGRNGEVLCFSGGLDTQEIGDEHYVEENLQLSQNYPNPFNPKLNSTQISFSCHEQLVEPQLKIYNIKGQLVISKSLNISTNSATWDGTGNSGKIVPSGIYLYKIESKNQKSIVKKMILMR